jgi:hypothetical protein
LEKTTNASIVRFQANILNISKKNSQSKKSSKFRKNFFVIFLAKKILVMMGYFTEEDLTPDVVNGIDMICNGF